MFLIIYTLSALACKTEVSVTEAKTSGLSISGSISAAQGSNIDSDVNDPNNRILSNSRAEQAQRINSPSTLAGYLTHNATQNDLNGDFFANSADLEDHYLVHLFENDLITLEINDWQQDNSVDFSLSFYPIGLDGVSEQISDGLGRYEQLKAPQSGTYRIVVKALTGASNYNLSLGSNGEHIKGILSTQKHFINDQFIISPTTLNSQNNTWSRSSTQAPFQISEAQLNELALVRLKGNSKRHQLLASHVLNRNNSSTHNSAFYKNSLSQTGRETQIKYQTLTQLKELQKIYGSEQVSLNYRYQAQYIPNDPMYSMQWHYPLIAVPQAWELLYSHQAELESRDTLVAVIDTGVYLEHEDLKNQLVEGYDFVSNSSSDNDDIPGIDNNPDDPGDSLSVFFSSWHGTHVAGIIAAQMDNNIGIAGIGINTKIMPLRALGVNDGNTYDIIQALRYAAGLENDSNTLPKRKADIINMSLGGSDNDPALRSLIQDIASPYSSTIIVAAAGNSGSQVDFYPAAYPEVISVSAIDADKQIAPYSNYGSSIDIAAPGGGDGQNDGVLSSFVSLSSDERSSTYDYYQGTSMATPHVSGVIALMKNIYPKLNNRELQNLLQSGRISDDLGETGKDALYGNGLINAYKAVFEAQSLHEGVALEPIITASSLKLSLTANKPEQIITLSQIGQLDTLSIEQIQSNQSWLNMKAIDSSKSNELGQYLVAADLSRLNDGLHHGSIHITANNNSTISIDVSVRISSQQQEQYEANAGALYVFLIDEFDNIIQQSPAILARDGQYHFAFTGLQIGTYYLQAGSDLDNDLFVCDEGESCAAWPILAEPQAISLTEDVRGLSFTATIPAAIKAKVSTKTNSGEMSSIEVSSETKKTSKVLQRKTEHSTNKLIRQGSPFDLSSALYSF